MRAFAVVALVLACAACRSEADAVPPPSAGAARNLLLITIDTLRADRIGAYGDRSARTPAIDALAARGARFTNAFAPTPITLPSHASILTGRYPAGHGARHNGIRIDLAVPTLTETLAASGLTTAAFVSAFPLDRRFGLIKGFKTYGDRMPRGADGRLANERPGHLAVDEAITWLQRHGGDRFFLWVHLFEPHAPYGDPRSGRSPQERYADDVSEADRQVGRLLEAIGGRTNDTLVVLTADHGEAFGEHGEIAHSIFVYDTTLRVPLIVAGPGIPVRAVDTPVSLIDIAPTAVSRLGAARFDADGIDLGPLLTGGATSARPLYAESFAPFLDFGWSPLRAVRADGWKFIAAPKPELYHVAADPAESRNLVDSQGARAAALREQTDRFSPDRLELTKTTDRETAARLQALGYVSGSSASTGRPDPKDRRELAARIARITSGELHGAELERVLREIIREDPGNPLANLRLGYVLLESDRCGEAAKRFSAAIDAKFPSADAHLGLAACQAMRRDFKGAAQTLRAADAVEPQNPVVLANLGLMLSDAGEPAAAIDPLQRALTIDPDMHQGRFGLAIAFARAGRRADAAAQAEELLRRLPPDAPQRAEVERLLAAVK
jgi:arylsulfatase A-like enzyme/cytochrome c-type biogenesis protein CcmH/NrfG